MNKIVWQKTVIRPGSPLKNTMLLRGLDLMFLKYTSKPAGLLIQGKKGTDVWYIDQKGYREFGKELIRKTGSLDHLRRLTKRTLKICDRFIRVTKKLGSENLEEKSNSELKRLLEEIHKTADDFPFVLWGFLILDSYLTDQLRQKLKEALKRKGKGRKFQKYFAALTTKTRLVAAEEEEIELLKIKAKLQKKGLVSKVNTLIENHSKKYAWLPVYDLALDPWNKSYFEQALEELTEKPKEELERRKRHLKNSKNKIRKILEELDDHKLSELVEIVQEFLVLRTYRTDALRKGYYNLKPFLKELARRLNWSEKEIPFLSIDEIYAFLSLPTRQEVKRRQKQVLVLKKGGYRVTSDKKEIKKVLKNEITEIEKEIKVLKGNVAYSGKVKGIVKTINKVKEMEKMRQGDILVSRMTFPDLMLAIKKAAAIVTDEGGITCHAAIVSREFGIPCVVGTKNATKFLKDGDLVEVDANKGRVKKIPSK